MKHCRAICFVIILSGICRAQCAAGSQGTNCSGPLTVQVPAGNKVQSALTLVDLGLSPPAPAAGQYTLSVASGVIMESNNGGSYHSLQGAPGAQGPIGPAGARGSVGPTGAQGPAGTLPAPSDYNFSGWGWFNVNPGVNEIGNSLYRNQINMASASFVRLVLTLGMNALPSGSYAQAEYTNGEGNWYVLSGEAPVTTAYGIYSSAWAPLPAGAAGDYVVRLVTFDSGSSTNQPVSLYQLHLQFK